MFSVGVYDRASGQFVCALNNDKSTKRQISTLEAFLIRAIPISIALILSKKVIAARFTAEPSEGGEATTQTSEFSEEDGAFVFDNNGRGFTPENMPGGDYAMKIAALDENGEQVGEETLATFNLDDVQPLLAEYSVAENTTSVGTVTSTLTDDVTFALAGGDDAGLFSVNPSTGALSFLDAPDFENPEAAGGGNVYSVNVQATDANNVTEDIPVEVEVTDEFETIYLQDNDLTIIDPEGSGSERRNTGDPDSKENDAVLDGGGDNTPGAEFDAFGLRYGYTSDGYLDINGGAADKATFSFDAPAGTYQITLRLANGSSGDRPIALEVEGNETPEQNTKTGDWSAWETRTFEVTVTGDGPHTVAIVQTTNDGAPNVDAIAVHKAGAELNFVAPEFTSSATFDVLENTTEVGSVAAADADGNDVTYSIVGGADETLFDIDPNTGALSFQSAPDFETPGSADSNNAYLLQLQASDGENDVLQDVTVNVTDDVGESLPQPVIAEQLLQSEASDITLAENDSSPTFHRLNTDSSTAEDPSSGKILDEAGLRAGYTGEGYTDFGNDAGDTVTYALNVTEAGLYEVHIRYSSQDSGGEPRSLDVAVNGGPAATTVFPTTSSDAPGDEGLGFNNWGVLTVQVALAANDNTISLAIPAGKSAGPNVDAVALTSVGETANFALPAFSGPASFTIAEGETAIGTVAAADIDNDTTDGVDAPSPSYDVTGGVDENAFSIDPATGALSLNDAANFEAQASYDVVVTASDGQGGETSQTIQVAVTDENDAPTAADTTEATDAGAAVVIDVASLIDDEDAGDGLTVTASVAPEQGTVAVTGTQITFTPADGFTGDASITYTVTDDADTPLSADGTVTVTVNEIVAPNNPPLEVGGGIADISIQEDSELEVEVPVIDVDGDPLTYQVTVTQDGNPATHGLSVVDGFLTGSIDTPGVYDVSINTSDSEASVDTGFVLTVTEAPVVVDPTETFVEAENFTGLATASNFYATGSTSASNFQLIKVNSGQTGSVSTQLADNGVVEGWYEVSIDLYDETDGSATFSLKVGDTVLADNLSFDSAGEFLNPGDSRGGAGQSGNLKRVSFEQPVYIDADTAASITGQADGELLRIDGLNFVPTDAPDDAPENLALAGSVAENSVGVLVGVLSATDPNDDAITFSTADPRFVILNGNELHLAAGVSLDHETDDQTTVSITATDAGNAATTADLILTVTDINEAPTLVNGASLGDITVDLGTEESVDLSGLGASDEDDGNAAEYQVVDANGGSLPAGISIAGTDLIIADTVPAGEYQLEISATDGALVSATKVPLTVTVADPDAFDPIYIQGESLTNVPDGDTNDDNNNLIRTESQNWERDGSPLNPEPNDTADNPDNEEFNALGLRPDYAGVGYLDINGADTGLQATTTFDAPAGTYEFTLRVANGSQPRPITVKVGDAEAQIADTSTSEWYLWETRTVTLTLTGDGPHTLEIYQDGTDGAPNIDAIAIHKPGDPIDFLPDGSADEDNNLTVTPVIDTFSPGDDLTAVEFLLEGVDEDIVQFEVSNENGEIYTVVNAVDQGNGAYIVTADLSGDSTGGLAEVSVRVTDNAGNEKIVESQVTISDEVQPFSYELQLETRNGDVTIIDTTGEGEGDPDSTQVRDDDNPESIADGRPEGLWIGHTGDGYLDMGGDIGDAFSFDVDAPAAGLYTFTFRYVNGSDDARPMELTTGDQTATIDFVSTTEWTNWTEVSVDVDLQPGVNTIQLANTIANGPNLDRVIVTNDVAADESADEDGNLTLIADDVSLDPSESATAPFTLTGIDADIATVEISLDGGVTRTEVTPDTNGQFTADLSSLSAGAKAISVFVTDNAGNEASATANVTIEAVSVDPITIQAEDETLVTITDTTTSGQGAETREVNETEIDDFGNYREGGVGDAYVDFGNNEGDTITFSVDAPVAGTYNAVIRYANGGGTDRPLDLSVNGVASSQLAFAPTPGAGQGWEEWTDLEVEVELDSGPNTVSLAIPSVADGGADNGPNIDQITFDYVPDDGVAPSEPGPRETIAINFQDGSTPKVDGYLVANFEGFADQGNGLSYGFVTEASAIDADGTTATPIGGGFPAVAINERGGTETLPDDGSLPSELTGSIDVSGYDPRLLGYAHTDLGGFPTRAAFELELENGWYEVTVAVGDTAGPNDSNNRLHIEGELVAEWTPTAAFKTELVTTTVKVEDGFLTLDGRGGNVTEFQYLEVRELPDLTPEDDREAPEDYASFIGPVALSQNDSQPLGVGANGELPVDINPTADIVVGIDVVDGRGGVLLESLSDGSVTLTETLTGEEVAIRSQTTGGFDSVTIAPDVDLKEHTSYTLTIDGFRDRGDNEDFDAPTREFEKFTTTFVTGEAPEIEARDVAFQETIEVDGFADGGAALTSVEMSPDGSKLYASSLGGTITRWDVGADGSLSNAQVLALDYFTATGRGIIGLTFDPVDPNTLWVTDNHEIPLSGRDNGVPDFSGQVTKITLGTGTDFTGTAETYVTGLPRSNGDHVTNSLEFRPNPDFTAGGDEPEYLLYLTQGSNSAMGEADCAWGFRPERLLNAAVLEIDPTRTDVPDGGFDVTTEPLPADGNNRRFDDPDGDLFNGGIAIDSGEYDGNFLHFDANGVATVRTGADASSDLVAEFYDPTADDAPVTVFATGTRNPYDLVWHSNGYLYVPTNGSAAGGNVPDDPATTGQDEGVNGVEKQDDYLFIIPEEGSTYSGHPNPLRGEYVLNGGNPTGALDPNQVDAYSVGIDHDPNYDPDYAYSVSENRSPNGAIEYMSSTFGSSLQNAVIFTQYSSGDNLRAVIVDPVTGLPTDDFILRNTNGQIISYTDPLDVIEGADGRLYMLTLNRGNGQSQIIRLDPEGTAVVDNTADADNDLSLTITDATDATDVAYSLSGVDADIQTLTVTFTDGTDDVIATPSGNGTFSVDLSSLTGEVTASLTVEDDATNSKTVTTIFTPGDDGGTPSNVIQPETFTILDTDSGTLVRKLSDPSTYEDNDNNDANNDGLNDGNTEDNYLDPNGPAEDKASFVYNASAAGTYTFTFRMANGSSGQDRAIAFKTGDQTEEITDTFTGSFGTWQDFDVELDLVQGNNTIVIEQTGTDGAPNIDKVTITPLDVADTTADVGGDLDLVAGDLSDPQNASFTISGADADIDVFAVTFADADNTVDATPTGNGEFTADLSTLSGEVTATLTVTDFVGNTEQEVAVFSLDGAVPNDGTEEVGGQTFVIYEAENADLDGPVVVTEERTQSGDFVDFDGMTDQTITWTVSVAQDGDYALDILYALSTLKDARPMTLTVDGQAVDTLPFVPNSNDDETEWLPQSTAINLTAGTHTIAVTAPAANGPNVDYLRISQSPLTEPLDLSADEGDPLTLTVVDQTDASAVVFQVAGDDDDIESFAVSINGADAIAVTPDDNGQFTLDTGITFGQVNAELTVTDDADNTAEADVDFAVAPDGNPNADIAVQSLDPTFFDDRLHFSFIQNPTENDGNGADRSFKDTGTVRLTNTGTETLEFADATVTGPFDLSDPTVFDNLTLAAGASVDIEVTFDATEIQPKPGDNQNGVYDGTLTIVTNDAEDPIVTVDLAGFWQPQPESGREPNVNEVWQLFGFGNEIAGLDLDNGGESDVLDFYDLYLPVDETEVLSPYWRIADGVSEATITQVAAFHGPGGASLGIHGPGDKSGSNDVGFGGHNNTHNQRILPLDGGEFFTQTFDNGDIPNGWVGNDVFGIEVAGLSTDPTLNPSGSGSVSAGELAARYPGYTLDGGTVIDPDGNEVPDGYTVRMFQAVNTDGEVIDNVYLGVMDYTGINYDYNDNMFIIEGVTPVGFGGQLSISDLTDSAADDRLVFSRIDNPANGQQEFTETQTFTITNTGIGEITIDGIDVTGEFEVTSTVPSTLAVGESADITVAFTGTDPSNDNQAVLYEGDLTVNTSAGNQSVALAGLAQIQSEGGEEPTVAQIVEAFGYSTNVEQGQLNGGGVVETVGDEVLLPYLQRLDGSEPITVTQIAAYLTNGRVGHLNLHEIGSSALTELYTQGGNEAQTLLPTDGNGNLATTTIDRDDPFGLKVTVDGFPTFSAWTDPEINLRDDAFNLGSNNEGHYIRYFEAKDANGDVIEGRYIAIQDYPGGENFDYNDHMYVIDNVQAYDPAGAEDADNNGVVDALETDTDNDGTPDFFDPENDTGGGELNRGDYVVGFNVGGPAVASQQGLNGLALLGDDDALIDYDGDGATRTPGTDNAGNPNGADALPGAFQTYRDGENWTVEVSGLIDGEYVVVLHTQETYWDSAGQRQFDIDINGAEVANNLDPFAAAGGNGDTPVAIEALVQVTGGSFTVTLEAQGSDGIDNAALNAITIYQSGDNPGGGLAGEDNAAPVAGVIADQSIEEGDSLDLDVSGSFSDPDDDGLTYTASGLPAGLSISDAGVIEGQSGETGSFTVTVTASDGELSDSASFTLTVDQDAGADTQSPFPGPDAPGFTAGVLTLDASDYDNGGQGIAYNDAGGLQGGTNGGRDGSDVEQTGAGDIGWIADGEWLEYTVNVGEAGIYDLDLLMATDGGPGRSATVEFYRAGEDSPYATSGSIANPVTGGWSIFETRSASDIALEAGEQVVRVTFNGGSQDFRSVTLVQQEPDNPQTPFAGAPASFTAGVLTVDATNFDNGGQDIAYNDNPGQDGGNDTRTETDVEFVGGQDDLGYVEPGEWVEYTIDVPASGAYALTLNAKTPIGGNTITVSVEEGAPLATVALPDANAPGDDGFGGTAFAETDPVVVNLDEGVQTLRFAFDGDAASNGYLLDFRSFTLEASEEETGPEQTAFTVDELPWLVGDGTTLEAALFDNGGQDVAFNDVDGASGSGARGDGMDVRELGAIDALGWISDGEWVEYTIDVEEAGAYDLSFLTATTSGGRSIEATFEQGGAIYESGETGVPNNGSWNTFVDSASMQVDLNEGEQVMRLTFEGGSMDLQSTDFDLLA